tara:strand:+ start:186 stop:380 length:195 start_codon:yes stop_codon:yes gene_type:complete
VAEKKKNKKKAVPLKDVPIEILLDKRTVIHGERDKDKKKEILKKMGIIQIANLGFKDITKRKKV